MQHPLQRTRFRPGPLLAIALACFALTPAVAGAHDPGLSSLDVTVDDAAIAVSLSLAAADGAAIRSGREAAAGGHLDDLAREAIRVSLDGETLPPANVVSSVEDGGARVDLSFARPSSSRRSARLTITSDVPKRMARGHRELLVVNVAGRVATETLLDAASDTVTVDLRVDSPWHRRAWSFFVVGVEHILSGYDHLAFLAGLILATRRVKNLVVALTAFTVAHSVSLMLVVFGDLQAPASIVEPLIAASIAWIGVETLFSARRDALQAVGKARWSMVFGFGLIHGFGFAGALMDLRFGSSPAEVALALASFNAGVEAGQLAATAALLPVAWMLRTRPRLEAKLVPACSMLVAVAGGWWLVERLA